MALTAVLVVLAMVLTAAAARADGDPASDVLISQNAFLPWDAGASASQQARLEALLQAAARGGYQIRVAVIASRSDLGSVTELWRQPQSYAQFLQDELSLVFHGRVLVVMPNGFGLYGGGPTRAVEQAALASTRAAAVGARPATVAISAVEKLAAASGHSVALAGVNAASRSAGVASGSDDAVSYIVFAVGAVLIAAAWTASLRARPVRLRHGVPSV